MVDLKATKPYKNGIFLAATKDSAFTIGTLMLNLKDKMGADIDKFYIAHDGFSQNDKTLMRQIAENKENPSQKSAKCEFIDFDKEIFLQKLESARTLKPASNHAQALNYASSAGGGDLSQML